MFVPRLDGYVDSLLVVTAAAHTKSLCKVPKKATEGFYVTASYRVIRKAVKPLEALV